LSGGVTEERDVQQIRFARVSDGRLCGRDFGRNQVRLHCVGVDAIIQLRQRAVEVPRQREPAAFVLLEPLEFLDEIDLEFRADPHTELKRDVFVRKRAAISSGGRFEADGIGFFHPILDADLVTVQPGLTFNYGEFAIIKIRVVDGFPDPQKLDGVAVSQPVRDEKVTILGLEHVGDRNEILVLVRKNGDHSASNLNDGFLWFAHGFCSLTIGFPTPSNSTGSKPRRISNAFSKPLEFERFKNRRAPFN